MPIGSAIRFPEIATAASGFAMTALFGSLRHPTVEMPSLVAVFASPVAVSSAVMVQKIGGDDQLASQLVVWTSAASMATIFAIVFVLRTIGAL